MRIIIALVSLFITGNAIAGDADGAADAVRQQEQAWADALLASDLETIDAIMHPAFRLVRTYSEDAVIDKAAYLAMQGMSANAVEITSSQVDIHDGVAVVHVTMEIDWSQEGVGKLPPSFALTDIWRKDQNGTWRVLSRVSQLAGAPSSKDD